MLCFVVTKTKKIGRHKLLNPDLFLFFCQIIRVPFTLSFSTGLSVCPSPPRKISPPPPTETPNVQNTPLEEIMVFKI